jgi:hypothetical protein
MTASQEFPFRDRDIGRQAVTDNFSLPESAFPVCRVRPIGAWCLLDFGMGAGDRFKDEAVMRMRLSKSLEDGCWHASS